MRLFDAEKMETWMREPTVNAIGTYNGWHFPMWVWLHPDGSIRYYDPGGLPIKAPDSVSYNAERARHPPPPSGA